VIGGGIAGLLSAQALTFTFDDVTIVERDHIGQSSGHRGGVPQDRHVHTLWAAGMAAIERLVPGVEQELQATGGVKIGFWGGFQWYLPVGVWSTRWPSVQEIVSCSRPLLEHVVRRRILAGGRVRLLDGHEVAGLRMRDRAVTGVSVRARGSGGGDRDLEADLVIDASGRRSRLSDWLKDPPARTVVDPEIGYATRFVTLSAERQVDFQGLYIQLAPPHHTRGAIMFPVENGEWVVTLLGACGDYPPTDEAGFLDFAESLRSPLLYQTISDAQPATPISGHRHTANQRRHYERLTTMPAGLVALGDSLCAFNPIYGQGMTVAAMQATELGEMCRRRVLARPDAARVSRSAQRTMARIAGRGWLVSASEDLRYPVTGGAGPTTRALHRYMDRVMLATTVDPSVAHTFLRVLNMLDKPFMLQRPDVMVRVIRGARRARRGRAGAEPRIAAAPSSGR
jgi:2-polyprenyl-6-methoxyphenol hydroxylase-like FAD-dependent oxidoreductase